MAHGKLYNIRGNTVFKVIKFSGCGAVLALLLVVALAVGVTSAICIPRAAPAAADNRVTLVIDAGHGGK